LGLKTAAHCTAGWAPSANENVNMALTNSDKFGTITKNDGHRDTETDTEKRKQNDSLQSERFPADSTCGLPTTQT
jgi:hypothetical protein